MSILVHCPHCGKPANAPDEYVGKKVRCARCRKTFLATNWEMEDDQGDREQILTEQVSAPEISPTASRQPTLSRLADHTSSPVEQDTKACPYCAELIAVAARKCKHCGEFLDGAPPSQTSRSNEPRTSAAEVTIWQGRPSLLYHLPGIVIALMICLFAMGLMVIHWLVGLPLLLFSLVVFLAFVVKALIFHLTAEYTHTSKRVMSKYGLLSRRTREVRITDIRSINMNQGMCERLFGLGTIGIGSAGTAGVEVVFVGIAYPETVRDRIRQSADGLA